MEEKLKDLLIKNKSDIVNKWINAIFDTYPKDTAVFLKTKEDRFSNPMGYTVTTGIQDIFEALIEDKDFNDGLPYLKDIIKVRAIQDFSPSNAISFIFYLKKIVRDQLEKEIRQNQIDGSLLKFESKVDDLALFAFNIYLECREQIYKLKTDELKRMTFSLLKRANLMSEIPVEEFELRNSNSKN